jgi:hypothetical protein
VGEEQPARQDGEPEGHEAEEQDRGGGDLLGEAGRDETAGQGEFDFRTSSACTYNNKDPRCVEVATNIAGKVVVRNSETGVTVEFSAAEWTDFVTGAKLREFDLTAWEMTCRSAPGVAASRRPTQKMTAVSGASPVGTGGHGLPIPTARASCPVSARRFGP